MIRLKFRCRNCNKSVFFIGGEVFTDKKGDYLDLYKYQIEDFLDLCKFEDYEIIPTINDKVVGIAFVEKQKNGDVRLYLKSKIFP